MELQAAKRLVENVFNSSYDRLNYLDLIGNLLKTYDQDKKTINTSKDLNQFNSFTFLGHYENSNKELGIYEVEVSNSKALLNARVAQRNLIASELKKEGYDIGLASFYVKGENQWRFSLVTFENKIDFSEEKIKFKENVSPSKRKSFLAGSNIGTHTVKKHLLPSLTAKNNPQIDDISEIFQVEAVNEDFYNEYKSLYLKLKQELEILKNKDSEIKSDFYEKDISSDYFAKKTLGQIIFFYFIQEKGLFKKRANQKEIKLKELFSSKSEYGNNFFNDILEPIFYLSLGKGSKHDSTYKVVESFDLPFLNGSLFEPMGNYNWEKTNILISDEFFENDTKMPGGEFGDGLFDVFDRYNFTVYENDPLEEEMAIDPEMLGKVFERLLDWEARKSKGAFYTPRIIVNFICKESLINYLSNNLDSSFNKNDITNFVINSNEADWKVNNKSLYDQLIKNKKYINDLLKEIKVLDPAIGSGAFGIGMLNEIVRLRKLIQEPSKSEENDYDLKLFTLSRSIYGIDIDPSAIEISRLRFWLALIIESDNENIQPLPNLEFKFICANALKLLPDNTQLGLFDNPNLQEELIKLRDKFFRTKNLIEKKKIKEKYLTITKQHDFFETELSRILKSYQPFDLVNPCDFYDSKLHHGIESFDVVIGNPPYVKEGKSKASFDGLRDTKYYQGKMDLWYMFACSGIDLLKKDKGVLSFIATNNWTTSFGASILRNKVLTDTQIINLFDFGNYMIFDNASIQTMIMLFQKKSNNSSYEFDYRKIVKKSPDLNDVNNLLNFIEHDGLNFLRPTIESSKYINEFLVFENPNIENLLEKIKNKSNYQLQNKDITNGIHPHPDYLNKKMVEKLIDKKIGDGVFAINNDELISMNLTVEEMSLIKPYYSNSKKINRYFFDKDNDEYLIYTNSSYKKANSLNDFPNIKKHLDQFQTIITSDNKPYGLHRSRDERFFKDNKIVSIRKCTQPSFMYVDNNSYFSAAFNIIKPDNINLVFLTGLLNSKLMKFWLKYRGKMQGTLYQVDVAPLINLPIRIPNTLDNFLNIIANLIGGNISEQETKQSEDDLDYLIYELYGLDKNDIEIIENSVDKFHD